MSPVAKGRWTVFFSIFQIFLGATQKPPFINQNKRKTYLQTDSCKLLPFGLLLCHQTFADRGGPFVITETCIMHTRMWISNLFDLLLKEKPALELGYIKAVLMIFT